jgi:hypothetical protein
MPELVELHRAWKSKGVRVEAVSLDWLWGDESSPATVEKLGDFAREHDLALPLAVVSGTNEDLARLAEHYGIGTGLPTSLAFDARGTLVDTEEGPTDRERFEAMIAKALGP